MDHVTTEVQRKALLVMSGDRSVKSYLDTNERSFDVFEVNGTKYTVSGSSLCGRDFTHYTPVIRIGNEKRILFNLAAAELSEVFQGPDMDIAMLHTTMQELLPAVGTLTVPEASKESFAVDMARDRFHQYICKFLVLVYKI